MKQTWAILTGAYPPACGGVADYTRLVARGLAGAGDDVHVLTAAGESPLAQDPEVIVHALGGGFDVAALAELDALVHELPDSSEMLVQYTPYAFGGNGMNLPFCAWLRSRPMQRITIMFHEVMHPIARSQPLRHNLLGMVHREMARLLVRAATRLLVSTPHWEAMLREQCGATGPIEWCPVPSNLPTCIEPDRIRAIRAATIRHHDELLVEHFGTYGKLIGEMLEPIFLELLGEDTRVRVVLVGRNSDVFQDCVIAHHPELRSRIFATGTLDPQAAAEHLAACDLLIQPYPDGITCRRSSFMAGLALGVPIVTNLGHLSEEMWRCTQAAVIAPDPSPASIVRSSEALLRDVQRRGRIRKDACELYQQKFALSHTIERLRAGLSVSS